LSMAQSLLALTLLFN